MGFKEFMEKIMGGKESMGSSVSEDYIELKLADEYGAEADVVERSVKVCKLKGFADVDETARELSGGNIVILDMKPLADRSVNELKHAVEEIKDVSLSMGGDIAGLSEYHLILTPPRIKIERESEKEDFEETMERVKRRMK